ncbi:MupG family TIM beta-alpha barrel fold protein [Companilactobacillus futsaii]|uniref:MupG family TIM beta-alpha barrel fold protein n=1 Tax=Companilactobacillus futsaii TaxID=938155 RepID=UPI0018A0A501|nr:MupG family TIM beta-alpha barrel fold protein [Companilactobacillus futsaii]
MLGFSYYLDHALNEDDKQYLQSMQQHNFTEIFTSLHIPEDEPSQYATRLQELLEFTSDLSLHVFVDIDKNSLKNLPRGLTGFSLRLDDGFTNQEIAQLSQDGPIALNASTLSEQDITELKDFKADFNNLEAWHNFYPRPETGLDKDWFIQKNNWLKQLGLTTQAFIPGNKTLRGPIYSGLPTLEHQRHQDLLASALELTKYGVDKIFIGDPRLDPTYQTKFNDYFAKGILDLCLKASPNFPPYLVNKVLHNRPDPAAQVVRIVESRGMNALNEQTIQPLENIPRNVGSITIDNKKYGRYMGEVQIIKTDLPMDEKVNVIGHLDQISIQLLAYISANTAFKINYKE